MYRENYISRRIKSGLHAPAAEDRLAEVDTLLGQRNGARRFPATLEANFRSDMAMARTRYFVLISVFGIGFYNLFLLADRVIMPDIFWASVLVHFGIVSPVMCILLYLTNRRVLQPEITVTLSLLLVFGSIVLFYSTSHAPYSDFVIFTIPVCLAIGNVVLPLPFVLSAWFTGFCIVASSLAMIMRLQWHSAIAWYAIMINANIGAFMLIATFRMEVSERQAYLVNLREKLRAEILDSKNSLLRNLSETDALTGVANRRAFDNIGNALWAAVRDRSESISMLLIDIDHFKALNDTYGHQVGDHALRHIAQCLKQHAFPGSVVARYGGEEFAVLLPDGNLPYARSCAEVMRAAVEELRDTDDGASLPTMVTVSIGLAIARPNADGSFADLLSAADRALYQAKTDGRNRIACLYDTATTSPAPFYSNREGSAAVTSDASAS